MKGFVKVQVLIAKNLSEYDELNVNMYWKTIEDFNRWKNSAAFKEAHTSSTDTSQDSPILGSEITISEIAPTLE
ncbi:heme-degrading monooxygenase IsdG [Neobacillus bataviensis LMG 21833]|uniref:Heme-degrading monooxygenase IsdG n=1 Tax=Neobacillus bataviensis LMG 21833 TaxID=1117379 RepID=K6DGH2_9BACI|nr:heme-degrading monooxygenase IsdG [Neobacillus bataviensis LMG 21833]